MQRRILFAIALTLGIACATAALAQDELPAPSPIEKELASRASHVTEVTLNRSMLEFAAKFMDKKDGDNDKESQAARQMIQNLKGVYVREYTFDKDKAYSEDELEGLRKYFQTTDWSAMVRERTKGSAQGTDVFVKLINGQMQGLFVLDAEPRELSLVLILGPINPDSISQLGGNFGIPKDAVKKAQKEVRK